MLYKIWTIGGHCHATSYKKHVLNGEFELVRQLMSETDFMEFEEAYISSAHEVESMMFYTCILDMIKVEESSELHDLAFLLLVYPLSEYEGRTRFSLLSCRFFHKTY